MGSFSSLNALPYSVQSMKYSNRSVKAGSSGSCWINRAREDFATDEGKALLKKWGVEGDYIGVGHCILGYPAGKFPPAAPRKADYITRVG